MKNIIAIVLLAVGILLAIQGIQTFQESTASLKILGLKLNASDEGGQTAGIMYLVLGVLALLGSFFVWKKK